MQQRSRLLAMALVAVLAVLGGAAIAALTIGGSGSSGATRPPASPVATPAGSTSPTGAEPSGEASGGTSPAPSSAESAVPSPSASPVPAAQVTLTDLRLDAADDPDGADRTLTFETGPGAIRVDILALSPQGNVVACLATPTKELGCRTGGSGRLTARTTKPRETFVVTLRGEAVSQPVAEVTLSFPSTAPSVRIEHARFDGTAFPDTNGIHAVVAPLAAGSLRVTAQWGGHPFPYRVELTEDTAGAQTRVFEPDGGDVGTDVAFDVAPPSRWDVRLLNTETGMGITPLDATLSWP